MYAYSIAFPSKNCALLYLIRPNQRNLYLLQLNHTLNTFLCGGCVWSLHVLRGLWFRAEAPCSLCAYVYIITFRFGFPCSWQLRPFRSTQNLTMKYYMSGRGSRETVLENIIETGGSDWHGYKKVGSWGRFVFLVSFRSSSSYFETPITNSIYSVIHFIVAPEKGELPSKSKHFRAAHLTMYGTQAYKICLPVSCGA